MRLKLFRFVEASSSPADAADNEGGEGAAVGVPPANRGEKEGGEKEKEEKKEEAEENEREGKTAKMEWKEVGIGPLRILERTEGEEERGEDGSEGKETDRDGSKGKLGIRLVQRRESTPGGNGTKLILNLSLRNVCDVTKQGDKFVRLSAFEAVVPEDTAGGDDKGASPSLKCVQYLLKAKTVMDADSLQQALQKGITTCSGKD